MSDKSAKKSSTKAIEEATAKLAIDSGADADVDVETGSAEDIFLSRPFKREYNLNGELIERNSFIIVVLTHSTIDAKEVTATPMTDAKGTTTTVRISKNKYPSYCFGNKLMAFTGQLFPGDGDAARGFSQSVYKYKGDNKVLVDVHFPNDVMPSVRKICDLHLEFTKAGRMTCSLCHIAKMAEISNVAAFEVQETNYAMSAQATAHQRTGTAELSE